MAEVEKKLYRLPQKGIIAGVAAGFADYFGMDVTIMRLIFVAIALLSGGAAVIAYIVLAIVMPKPGDADNKENVTEKIKDLTVEISNPERTARLQNYFGLGLVILGSWLLIGQFLPKWFDIQWSILWPLAIVVIGIWILRKGKDNG